MEPLLFLAHRIPYPPNKGDKIRSYHLLRHLSARYEVHVGAFVDAPDDRVHVPALGNLCASLRAEILRPRAARLLSVAGLLTGEPLTLPYYRSRSLQSWVDTTVARHGIRKAVVFSAAMAQYVERSKLRWVLDFVDVDSAKWSEYAERRRWPSSVVFRREGRKLGEYERRAAEHCHACAFVTRAEADLFLAHVPVLENRVHVIENGVDTAHFDPSTAWPSPFGQNEVAIVFTGAMDYWPNVDAVTWFAREVMPRVLAVRPDARFYVVGMNPTAEVAALAANRAVTVTGSVEDTRPYLQHAAAVVAPLRVARGVQNKVLEAMAMGRPVVVSRAASRGVSGLEGRDFASAATAGEFTDKLVCLLGDVAASAAMGEKARQRILDVYSWERSLARFDHLLDPAVGQRGFGATAQGAVG